MKTYSVHFWDADHSQPLGMHASPNYASEELAREDTRWTRDAEACIVEYDSTLPDAERTSRGVVIARKVDGEEIEAPRALNVDAIRREYLSTLRSTQQMLSSMTAHEREQAFRFGHFSAEGYCVHVAERAIKDAFGSGALEALRD